MKEPHLRILVVANNIPPAHSGAGVDNVRNYSLLVDSEVPVNAFLPVHGRDYVLVLRQDREE